MEKIEEIWSVAALFKNAFGECKICLRCVCRQAEEIINVSGRPWKDFEVKIGRIPDEFLFLRKNIFSTVFQSLYQLLGVNRERRLLYGKLNYLFRIWVTSADNLLDSEDKVVLPVKMIGDARIMRQVISIMAADRIMKRILDEAVEESVITREESAVLSEKSLQILLPSAAEEASEEGGISQRPDPDYVLNTIHRLKTGFLFHIPFLGPDTVEKSIDQHRLKIAKDGLFRFGLGCQLLDDIRDMAKDYLESRHNYVLSRIYWDSRAGDIEKLKEIGPEIIRQESIFGQFREAVYPAAELAGDLLEEGLCRLDDIGLGIGRAMAGKMAETMFNVLDVGELLGWRKNTQGGKGLLLQAAPLMARPEFMTY